MSLHKLSLVLISIFLISASAVIYLNGPYLFQKIAFKFNKPPKVDTPKSTPEILGVTGKVKYPADYTIVLVGDSMTERLGNADELKAYLKEDYPNKTFQFLNYGYGATNILSVPERLEKTTFYGREFMPIIKIEFDLLLLESFGHNPLSSFPLEEGLKKQEETLDKIMEILKRESPSAKIVFVATISPNKKNYARNLLDLSAQAREIWANERVAYIKNHVKYANDHNIPVVNVYGPSLDENGEGKLIYIRDDDYIHPSPTGIYFISEQIENFIFEKRILAP